MHISGTGRGEKLQIAYVTEYDATDIHNWSGLGYYIAKALLEAGSEVELLGNLGDDQPSVAKFINRTRYFYNSALRWFMINRSIAVAQSYATEVAARLQGRDIDVVFSPSSFPVAFLETDKPKVFYTDATFASMLDYYPGFSNLSNTCIEAGHRIERQALQSCSLAIYSSEWAARSAIEFYGADPGKVKVVPFGANISNVHQYRKTYSSKQLNKETIEFLFIGVDWYRKGGETVLQSCKELQEKGLDVRWHIVGINKVPHKKLPAFVTLHGFLDKNKAADSVKLEELYRTSDFLFVPSVADCSPVVFTEAAAYALPVISRETGGIPSIIKHNYNGILLPSHASVADYVESIMNVIDDRALYCRLSENSFKEYNERLNWNTAGKSLFNLLNTVVSNKEIAEAV